MRNVWVKALYVQQPKIFGRQLRPFSLAHGIALRAIESPFMVGGTATPIDLYVALEICRRTAEELRRDLFRISGRKFLRWFLFGGKRRFDTAVESLRVYIEDHVDAPTRKTPATPSKASIAAPYEYHLHRVLCNVYGYYPSAAWDESYVMARCLFDTNAECNGDDMLVSEDDEAVVDIMVKAKEAHQRGDFAERDRLYEEANKAAAKIRGDT